MFVSAWRTMALCGCVIVSEGYDMGVMGGALLFFRRTPPFNADTATLGAVSSAALIGMFAGSPLGGRLAHRLGAKSVLTGAFALFCTATLACATAGTLTTLAFWRGVAGLGMGAALPCAAALTTEHSPARHAARNYAIMYSGYSIGILAAALISIPVLAVGDWRLLFLIGGAPCLLLPLLMILLPESTAFLNTCREETPRPQSRLFPPGTPGAIACFSMTLAIGLFLIYGLGTWLPTLLALQGHGTSASLDFLALFSLSSAVGGIASGSLADRFGTRPVLVLSFLGGAAASAMLMHPTSQSLTLLAVCVAGYASVASSLILTGYAASWFPPASRAAATGLILGLARLGAIGGPFIAGLILRITAGDIAWVVRCFGVLFALAACLSLLIPAPRDTTEV